MPASRTYKAVYFHEQTGFVLIKILGAGSFGVACLVKSCHNGKYYVRKEEVRPIDEPHVRIGRPIREVQHALIMHGIPSCARIVGWTNYKDPAGRMYTVSYWDFYDGGSLLAFLLKANERHIKIPERWVAGWCLDLLQGIRDCHKNGIAHRDAHARNVFLHRGGSRWGPQAQLGDFGISVHVKSCSDGTWARLRQEDFKTLSTVFGMMRDYCRCSPEMSLILEHFGETIDMIPPSKYREYTTKIADEFKRVISRTGEPNAQQYALLDPFKKQRQPIPYHEVRSMEKFRKLRHWHTCTWDPDRRCKTETHWKSEVPFITYAEGDWDGDLKQTRASHR